MALFKSKGPSPMSEPPLGVPQAPVNQAFVQALSLDGVRRVLDNQGFSYTLDPDGYITGVWEDNPFTFRLAGARKEYLHIQARWQRTVTEDEVDLARRFIEQWHREMLWPTLSVTRLEDGSGYAIGSSVASDWEYGATDAQLLLQVNGALMTTLRAFESLGELLDDRADGATGDASEAPEGE